ncbi:hypothetical protein [Streptomyces roseolus]|uniref:hypothetical protein n=1 Tax=Streptomyces roseolus TaxID=67358 RepID=UPI003792BCD4
MAIRFPVPAPELPGTLDTPGKVAAYPSTTELEPAGRAALDQGSIVHVSAASAVHRGLLTRYRPLDGSQGLPAVPVQRKAAASTRTGSASSHPEQDRSSRWPLYRCSPGP